MPEAKISKTYVRPDNSAVITCPYCSRQKTLQVTSLKQHKSKIKIKCACKNVFIAILEFRKRVRKRTNLTGTYINHTQKKCCGKITLKNISVSGLEFSTMDLQNFNVDDEVTVEFSLDDDHRTKVSKDVIVREVRKFSVGCEFTESADFAFDGPLASYVSS
jgi:hypothetical protein